MKGAMNVLVYGVIRVMRGIYEQRTIRRELIKKKIVRIRILLHLKSIILALIRAASPQKRA